MVPDTLRACSGNLQGGARLQAQGDVPMPGIPAAYLVLVQPHLALRPLEALLDRQAGALRRCSQPRGPIDVVQTAVALDGVVTAEAAHKVVGVGAVHGVGL